MKGFRFICVALTAAMLWGCAKEGFPSGGPKDVTPPKVLATTPQNGTLNFSAREFYIATDEYVQVKDAENNILVSPPMKVKPEYTPKGHGLQVKIKDTLRENTTYLFQFKGGIADFNEGNPLESFEYVFSTGSVIDSMTLRGRVLDAFTGKPREEAVTVVAWTEDMLADSVAGDSAVAKVKPMYMTRTDKEGQFMMNHLRPGRYCLLALEDGDKNLMLSTDEPVAFLDSLVTAHHMPAVKDTTTKDSTAKDSTMADTSVVADTALADSLALGTEEAVEQLQLLMSQLKVERQRVTKSEFLSKGKAVITTAAPLQHYSLAPLDSLDSLPLYIHQNRKGDTLTVWTARADCDSVVWLLRDTVLHDTLSLKFRPKSQAKLGGKGLAAASMKSRIAATHPYYDTLRISFETPIASLCEDMADSAVEVFNLTDSTRSFCGLRLTDSCRASAFVGGMIDFKGKAGEKYRFTVRPGVVKDIYGKTNADSLVVTTQYDKAESYGNIVLSMQCDSASNLLLQLIDEKGNTLRQQKVEHSGKYTFEHLKGGKYSFRLVEDADANGQWTPGSYWQHRQPEVVRYYEKTLELRENWDMEETWRL